MFLLNILLSGLVLLKCFFTRAMNLDPIFVVTAALKGGGEPNYLSFAIFSSGCVLVGCLVCAFHVF